MIAVTSLSALLGGVGLIASAPRVPARVEQVERVGGLLLALGLVLLGFGLARLMP